MRIAQVSPLYESVPPKLYGGTERVVCGLAEALLREGHDVTVFASGDSKCPGRLIAGCNEALRLRDCMREPMAAHLYMLEKVRRLAGEFDVIHFQTEYLHFPLARELGIPNLSTMHGRLDLDEYVDLFSEFRDLPLASISLEQQRPLPGQNWVGVVHNGIPRDQIAFTAKPQGYLAFLGRISPDKGILEAIEISHASGLKLKVAAKVDRNDRDYFQSIRHLLESDHVEFIGEINDSQKSEFLGGAAALLFPIKWPEPFGLVMIEALAAGTPVVAFRSGSVPEVISDGVTGFIVGGVDEAVRAVNSIVEFDSISRMSCRKEFEERFTSDRMAQDYVAVYRALCAGSGRLIADSDEPTLWDRPRYQQGGLH